MLSWSSLVRVGASIMSGGCLIPGPLPFAYCSRGWGGGGGWDTGGKGRVGER